MNYNWDWSVFFKSTGVGSETYLDWFISGLGWTIAIAVVAWIVALILGSLLGVMRTLPNRFIAGIATVYVEIFRNVPLLVQLFIWYFLVPDLLPPNLQEWYKQDLNPTTSAYLSVVVCLGLFTAARVCEQVRTGIEALPRGQEAAARAMGFSMAQIYWNVLLPQARFTPGVGVEAQGCGDQGHPEGVAPGRLAGAEHALAVEAAGPVVGLPDAGGIVGGEALAEEFEGRRGGSGKGMSDGDHARIIL